MKYPLIFFFIAAVILPGLAQAPVAEWTFHPDYRLPGQAANYPGPRLESPQSNFGPVGALGYPFVFKDEEPSQRIVNFLPLADMPEGPFSVEMWLVNHVDQPIGALATVKSFATTTPPILPMRMTTETVGKRNQHWAT